ncbi:MFS transporter [Tumebacillus sp. DT12]|uniref:MFS transporter n=1 Tax=Tumebacillus lacus TaxID=2995335 RepID=A0ABT3X7G2_9BACL|nr:MFS transporter [Tumebacillus lacus]MCX7571932.1 MFS transporter [Tumebacillus lacus]
MHEQEAYRSLRHNVRINTIQGIFSVVATNLTTAFIPMFAIKVLEASDVQVAWLSSLPALTGILVLLPGAFFIDRLAAKKRFTGTAIAAGRMFFLMMALLPLMSMSPVAIAWAFVVLNALMNLPQSLALLSWQAFIGDVIPAAQRAKVFGMRNRITQGVGIITTILTGLLIVRTGDHAAWPYQAVFLTAFAVGMLEAAWLMRIREPFVDPASKSQTPIWETVRTSMRSLSRAKRFLLFAAASTMFHFGWQMAWPLFNIYQVSEEYVGMSALWVSLISVFNGLAAVLTYRLWGRVADRIGNGLTLVIGTAGLSTAPFLYALTSNLWLLLLSNLWMGIFVACTTQTLFNRVLELSPHDNRAFFIAMHSIFIGVTAIFAPQFGVWVMGITSIETAFHISSLWRLTGAGALLWVALWERRRHRAESGRGIGL